MSQLIQMNLAGIVGVESCDRCPATCRLAVIVGDKNRIPIGPLALCKHHGDLHEVALVSSPTILVIEDQRASLGRRRDNISRDHQG